jgi:methylthioribulose-1-phosphate dehydratase
VTHAEASVRADLVALGARYDRFGWVLGTGGNLSARSPDAPDTFLVTASGRHKGLLGLDDFVRCQVGPGPLGSSSPGSPRPSAEASIHRAVYAAHAEAAFALHVHTPTAVVSQTSHRAAPGSRAVGHIVFEDLEMVKAWGHWGDRACVAMPVFENHADVARIAEDIAAWFAAPDLPEGASAAPALLIRTHGVTAWGADAEAANRHLETAEFLLQVLRAR